MRTVLVVEDEFIAGYELELRLRELGYAVRLVATAQQAKRDFDNLKDKGELAAIVCDNRLIGGRPAASFLYWTIRRRDRETPFIVYSGFPPEDLPSDDPRLKVVRKPFIDAVLAIIEQGARTHAAVTQQPAFAA